MQVRVHVIFSGRVQGVGFRFTAVSIAERLGVTGWVKNLSGKGVELVGEQKKEALEDFLSRLEQEFAGYIADRDVRWEPAAGEFKDFDIRYS